MSMSQALIAMSLAVSILTFAISLIEFLPMRQDDLSRQESLQYNTFVCLVLPIVLAYCSQSRVMSALTQKWLLLRQCNLSECLTFRYQCTKLGDALQYVANVSGISCVTGQMNFLEMFYETFTQPGLYQLSAVATQLGNEDSMMNSSRLITTNLTLSLDTSAG